MADDFREAQPAEYLRMFLKGEFRPDSRAVLGCRDVRIHCNTVNSALGSAMVCYGDTRVIAGVKGKFASPGIDTPNHGYLIPNILLPPLCNNKYKPGPPSDSAVAISHKLSVITADMVSLSDLCITPGKVVWVITVDVVCINDDGNVFDAAVLALTAALYNTSLPATHVQDETGFVSIHLEGKRTPLQLRYLSIPVSIAVFDDSLLPDPTEFEEEVLSGMVSCCIDDNGKIRQLWNSANLTDEKLSAAFDYAVKRSSVLLSVLKKVSST